MAMQVADTQINLLFLKEKQAEEVKLNFSKAKSILGFSFVFGDDFNFFVVTNSQIDLYEILLSKQRAKLVKSITFSAPDSHSELYYDPLANVVCICDTQKGQVQPFFLNMYKSRNHKGKTIQLDADNTNTASNFEGDGVQGSQAQSSMNATASVAGGSSASQLQSSAGGAPRASFRDKALSFFKGSSQTLSNI